MLTRTTLLVIVFGMLALFTALNWASFTTPMSLSVGFAEVKAPLGLVLLGVIALLSALFLAFAAYLQAAALFDARRFARELDAQRQLADRAEASRFTDLQARLEAATRQVVERQEESERKILERVDRIDGALGGSLERTERSIAAYIGELEDRIARGGLPRAQ